MHLSMLVPRGEGGYGMGWGLWSETQILWQTSPALGKVSSSKFPTEGIEIQEVDRLNNTHTPGLKIAVFSCNNWNERTLEETNGLSVTKDWANFYYFSFLHLVSALRGLLGKVARMSRIQALLCRPVLRRQYRSMYYTIAKSTPVPVNGLLLTFLQFSSLIKLPHTGATILFKLSKFPNRGRRCRSKSQPHSVSPPPPLPSSGLTLIGA